MLLRFKTPRDINGHRKYICIDTEENTYTRVCPTMFVEGIEIRPTAFKELLKQLQAEGFEEVRDII